MTNPAPPPSIVPSPAEPAPREFDMLCEACGYSLIGIMSDRCPECGKAFDPTELPLARIPWLYRVRLGVVSAYLQTTMMILTRGGTFAAEMCRPVRISAEDARSYRRLSIVIAIVSALLAAAVIIVFGWLSGELDLETIAFASTLSVLAIPGVVILFALGTDMPTFIWRGLPDAPQTLAPLHHYAAAPLALLAPLSFGMVAVVTIDRFQGGRLYGIIALMAFGVLFMLWITPLVLMRGGSDCSTGRLATLAAYLPIHWLLIGFMCFMGFAGVTAVAAAALDQVF